MRKSSVLAVCLCLGTVPALAAEVVIGSVSSTVTTEGGSISSDLFAKLLDALLEGLKRQQQQQDQRDQDRHQQRTVVSVPTGYAVTGVTNLGMFGEDGETSASFKELGDDRWEVIVDTVRDTDWLESKHCPDGRCGGDYLLGTLLLAAVQPPGPILLAVSDLTAASSSPPEVTIESVDFLLAGQIEIRCDEGGACVTGRVPAPGSLALAAVALAGLVGLRPRRLNRPRPSRLA